jgi:hypothetical protein
MTMILDRAAGRIYFSDMEFYCPVCQGTGLKKKVGYHIDTVENCSACLGGGWVNYVRLPREFDGKTPLDSVVRWYFDMDQGKVIPIQDYLKKKKG